MDALVRLVESIYRFLDPEQELEARAARQGRDGVRFVESRPVGGAWLLHGVWDQLGIGETLLTAARDSGVPDPEGLSGCVWAMVANRALEPLSKHALPEWLDADVDVPGAPEGLYDERLYRAMDFLLECGDELQKVFFACADLLNLEVDLLLYDTTSVYCEMEADDREQAERQWRWAAYDAGEGPEPSHRRPQTVNDPPLRLQGHSKDHRPDLAQVVVGLAVTREGIPVRCWVRPGNTNDATTVTEVKRSLVG